ncbi:hypothetical protein [Streptomyces sp. NPDC059009]|uniref:hypothetical protein n=1 Tax=Streptomyces sp. NPDC059009 TaxID=3346694 RepID=UPI0036B09EAD
MTTTDSAGHPDVAEISELTEGLLPPSRSIDIRRHLDDCALCTDVYDSLEEIRGMLGTLPGPSRMPTDVTERIDAALAAEALLDASTVNASDLAEATSGKRGPSAEPEEAPDVPASAPAPVAHVSRETAIPAATAGGSAADRPAGHPRAATGPGRRRERRSGRAGRRRITVLGAVVAAAAIGLGTLLMQNMGEDGSKDSQTETQAADPHAYSTGRLQGQVHDLLTKGGAPKKSFDVRSSPRTPDSNPPEREPTVTIPDCINRSLDGKTPLAAERGTYEGKTAYLVVVDHATDSSKVSAYVIDGACADKSSSGTSQGTVLLTRSYSRS